jgi:hypothetical protein
MEKMVFGEMAGSLLGSLSSQQALALANIYFENALIRISP